MFDKYAWLKALQADPRLTAMELRLGLLVCTTFTRADGTGWLVELDTIAASVPGGLSRNRLNGSLGRLVQFGYLAETARAGGGRGLTGRRAHDLETPTASGAGLGGNPNRQREEFRAETPTASGGNPNRQRLIPQPPAVENVCPDVRKPPPTCTPTGTSSGGARAREAPPTAEPHQSADAPPRQSSNGQHPAIEWLDVLPPLHWDQRNPEPPEPARFCQRHPGGTTDRCAPCGDARKAHEAWTAQRAQWRHARAEAERAYTAACDECDEHGWFLGPDGTPYDDPAMHCPHARKWDAYWQRVLGAAA